MTRHPLVRAIAGALVFTLAYTPVLGSMTGTVAAAQAVQNSTYSYQYDTAGNLTQVTDPLGNVTTATYDALNRVSQQQLPVPATGVARPVIAMTYDGQDQPATVTDPRSLNTSYTVDGLGNQTALSSPDTGSSTQTYDEAGNVLTSTDARGKVVHYTYDALNRLTNVTFVTDTAIQFEYDGGTGGTATDIGHLTKMTDGSGHTTYQYDAFGRLLLKTQTTGASTALVNLATRYTYGVTGNTTGKLVSMTYPSGNKISYTYDAAGQVSSLSWSGTSGAAAVLLSDISYVPFGGVQGWKWGSGEAYARTFDLDGRVTSYPLGSATADGLLRTVTYDAGSRITAMTHVALPTGAAAPAYDQSFTYDNLDRLTGVITATSSQGYTYDASGNRTHAIYGGTSYAYSVSTTSNRLAYNTGPAPAVGNNYDAAGNVISDTKVSESYNDLGRPKAVSNGSLGGAGYAYNGLGQRTVKSAPVIPTTKNYYAYDEQGHLLGEYDINGVALQETVYLGDMPVAVLAPDASAVTQAYYVFADHINTPRVITAAATSAIVWRWDNADPFGVGSPIENPSGAGTFTYNPRFPGQLYDKETNYFYNYYRTYDPKIGRYVQSDPIGLNGGINTYSYVGSNPLGLSDPTGLVPNPLELTCIDPLQPFCWAGVATDLGSWALAAAGTTAVAAAATIPGDSAKKEDCDCGPFTRVQAMAQAQAWAQVPRASRGTGENSPFGAGPGRTPIDFSRLNSSSRGQNFNNLKAKGASGLGYTNPLSPETNYVFDHPDGHDDDNADHHKCPHIHAYHPTKGSEIFRYKAG
jgi:RHS repeat-associated protein